VFVDTVTWRWMTDIPETPPVIYCLTKKGIKGILFEKKVIFLLRSREIAWLRQCGSTTNYDIHMMRATTSPFTLLVLNNPPTALETCLHWNCHDN
jgi:hypothetical protein